MLIPNISPVVIFIQELLSTKSEIDEFSTLTPLSLFDPRIKLISFDEYLPVLFIEGIFFFNPETELYESDWAFENPNAVIWCYHDEEGLRVEDVDAPQVSIRCGDRPGRLLYEAIKSYSRDKKLPLDTRWMLILKLDGE